ncbi:MAG: wax ester/triacylglycerol synthase family O-acyltransferase [Parvibaculum sp.]
MKRLSVQDAAFLQAESIECPMHIASVQIYDLPKKYEARRDFVPKLMQRFGKTAPSAPFNLKLHSDWSKLDVWPSWVEEPNVDLDYHVRYVALPAPGGMDQLMRLVERLHEPQLDRRKPLWELYFIDGLEGNRLAIYFKTHHAMIDGVAGMALIAKSLSPTKSSSGELHPIWQIPERKQQPTASEGMFAAWRHSAEDALTQINSIGKLTGDFLRKEINTLAHGHIPSLGRSQAPKTQFNVPIKRHRHLSVFSLPLSRTKEIAKDFNATVNDVVLAVSGSAIRRYLSDAKSLPGKPVLASCPVSVRAANAEQAGNNISIFIATTGSDIKDPVERLKAITHWASKEKHKIANMSPAAAQNYATIFGLSAMLPQMVGAGDIAMPPSNVVISNVPGPRQPLYLGDAKLTGIFPVSVLIDYQGFNITVLSREDSLDFGLIAAHEAIHDLSKFATYMQDAFDELDAASNALLENEVARVTAKVKARKASSGAQARRKTPAKTAKPAKPKAGSKTAATKLKN